MYATQQQIMINAEEIYTWLSCSKMTIFVIRYHFDKIDAWVVFHHFANPERIPNQCLHCRSGIIQRAKYLCLDWVHLGEIAHCI